MPGNPFTFLEWRSDGTPVRWDPCAPIHYVVNLARAPAGVLPTVKQAVERVTEATHLDFRFDGLTGEVPDAHRASVQLR
jgi:hypothetical protein